MDDRKFVAEDMARALAKMLLRLGVVSDQDMAEAADIEEDGTEKGATVAHLMRLAIVEKDLVPEKSGQDEMWVRHRRKQIIARTRYIELHGHAPPASMEEGMQRLRERQARERDGGKTE